MTREEAYKLAMQACRETWNEKTVKQIEEALKQEPCEDAISRQAALEKAIDVPIAKVVTEDKVIYRKIMYDPATEVNTRWEPQYDTTFDKIISEIEREADYQDAEVNADIARGMYKAIEIVEKYKTGVMNHEQS